MNLRETQAFIIDTIKRLLIIVVILFIITLIVPTQQIIGTSMSPTLNDKEIVILSKIHYHFNSIKRFDLVSIKYDTKKLVKRVIALPGETIEYKDNILYINDRKIEEVFLSKEQVTESFSLKHLGYETIPEDMYFVLNDNRSNSLDSREIGLIKKDEIIGKIHFRIWPINKMKIK